jgi:alpha-beta hydrolase superfamily lysophospholipase
MQTHLAMRTLKGNQKPDRDVQVLFAVQPNHKALLFIHGFNGNAIKTWSDFHELLPECSTCSGHDVYFYGYDGLRAEMNSSAAIFRVFLHRLFEETKKLLTTNLPRSAQRQDNFEYDELVIVAHSLGAVISRRALLDATKEHSDWVARTKLVLYAPAHKGAYVADLAVESVSSFWFLKLFAAGVRFKSPLIDELRKESPMLKKLLEDTQAATKDPANRHLVAKRVILAEYDNIVTNEAFGDDPPPYSIPDTTHTTVCKPTRDFLDPLTHLEACL